MSIRSLFIRICFAIIAPMAGVISDAFGRPKSMIIIGLAFSVLAGTFIFIFLKTLERKNLFN